MQFQYFILFLVYFQNSHTLESTISKTITVKGDTFKCSFNIQYDKDKCFQNSTVSCSPNLFIKRIAKNVDLELNDGTKISIKKLKISGKKDKIIKCEIKTVAITETTPALLKTTTQSPTSGTTTTTPALPSTTSPIPTTDSGCVKEDNIDYYGNDIKNKIVNGLEECISWCGETTACGYWTFVKSDKRCYLKTSDSGRTENAIAISGTKNCATETTPALLKTTTQSPTSGCVIEDNINYFGNQIGFITRVSGFEECINICGEATECGFWTYEKSDKLCYLMSSVSDKTENSNRISGTRNCAIGTTTTTTALPSTTTPILTTATSTLPTECPACPPPPPMPTCPPPPPMPTCPPPPTMPTCPPPPPMPTCPPPPPMPTCPPPPPMPTCPPPPTMPTCPPPPPMPTCPPPPPMHTCPPPPTMPTCPPPPECPSSSPDTTLLTTSSLSTVDSRCSFTDKNSNCATWKDPHCTSGKWVAWMMINCAKTCKCTTTITPALPSTTTPISTTVTVPCVKKDTTICAGSTYQLGSWRYARTAADCQGQCKYNSNCKYWNWVKPKFFGAANCALKNTRCPGTTAAAWGFLSGEKMCDPDC